MDLLIHLRNVCQDLFIRLAAEGKEEVSMEGYMWMCSYLYFASCLIFNVILRECSILIMTLPTSLSRGLLPFFTFMKFLSQER